MSTFSLASVEKKKTFKERKINNDLPESKTSIFKSNFTQQQLENSWNYYHNIKLKNKEFNIASLLKISEPKKIDNVISYSVTSEINKKELEKEIPKLLDFIKKALKNDLIEVKIDANSSIKKNILYTPSEKFQKLVEINPSLEKLRKELDLDY